MMDCYITVFKSKLQDGNNKNYIAASILKEFLEHDKEFN